MKPSSDKLYYDWSNFQEGKEGYENVSIRYSKGTFFCPCLYRAGSGRRILETAHVAPTAANMQPVRLIVVRSREGLAAVSESANIYSAPVAVVVCADKSKAWTRPFDGMVTTDIDASILTDHMMLMATELGLGSVWICYFKPDVLKQGLGLPENLEPVNILALGYSAEPEADKDRHSQTRIPMDELVQYK